MKPLHQGIVAYRLNHRAPTEDGIVTVNPAANDRFLVFIDNETWMVHSSGQHEFKGKNTGPCMVAGTRVDTLKNLPGPVQEVIAARCEHLDGLKFQPACAEVNAKGD